MSVADKLGTGSSFSKAPRGRSARGRAKAVTQGDVPAYELVRCAWTSLPHATQPAPQLRLGRGQGALR